MRRVCTSPISGPSRLNSTPSIESESGDETITGWPRKVTSQCSRVSCSVKVHSTSPPGLFTDKSPLAKALAQYGDYRGKCDRQDKTCHYVTQTVSGGVASRGVVAMLAVASTPAFSAPQFRHQIVPPMTCWQKDGGQKNDVRRWRSIATHMALAVTRPLFTEPNNVTIRAANHRGPAGVKMHF